MSRVALLHLMLDEKCNRKISLTTKHILSLLKTSFKQTNVILYRAQKAALLSSIILHSIVFSRKNFFFNCQLGFVKKKEKNASIFRYIEEATF